MCRHLSELAHHRKGPVTPSTLGCLECLEKGGEWVHLRLCLTCGHVGCCDSSPNRHATRHFHATHHPVIKSFEPGETWAFCYLDLEMAEGVKGYPAESPPEHFSAPENYG